MSTRALIAVALPNGGYMAAHVAYGGDELLAETLKKFYPTQEAAGNLLTLGNLLSVGRTIAKCEVTIPAAYQESVYCQNDEELEAQQMDQEQHIHVFCNGAWQHFVDEDVLMDREISGEE